MRKEHQAVYLSVCDAARRGDMGAMRHALGDPPGFPNVRDPYLSAWVLTTAISSGPTELVAALLENGADPNVDDHAGFPPILAALDAPEPRAIVGLLVEHGADLAKRGTNDWTALHWAANAGDLDMVVFLLELGADPNLRTAVDDYTTPLEEAVMAGHDDVAEILRPRTGES